MKTLQQKIAKWKAKIAKAEAEMAEWSSPTIGRWVIYQKPPKPNRTHKWMKGDLVFIEPKGLGYNGTNIKPTLGVVKIEDTEDPLVNFGANYLYFSDSYLTLISDQEFAGEEWL